MPQRSLTATTSPASLLEGARAAACKALGIASLGHVSALRSLRLRQGFDLAGLVHSVVLGNWIVGRATENKERSSQNWRWCLQPQISPENRSPEVVLERAIAVACANAGRSDWANQIPVASGLMAGAGDRRRAIDLAYRCDERRYEFIELKIASDTPLSAAVQLLGYASVWLLSRADPPVRRPALLDADNIDLRVLAPAAYYRSFELLALEQALNGSVRSLGNAGGVRMSFAFAVLSARLAQPPLPAGDALLDLLTERRPLHDRVRRG